MKLSEINATVLQSLDPEVAKAVINSQTTQDTFGTLAGAIVVLGLLLFFSAALKKI